MTLLIVFAVVEFIVVLALAVGLRLLRIDVRAAQVSGARAAAAYEAEHAEVERLREALAERGAETPPRLQEVLAGADEVISANVAGPPDTVPWRVAMRLAGDVRRLAVAVQARARAYRDRDKALAERDAAQGALRAPGADLAPCPWGCGGTFARLWDWDWRKGEVLTECSKCLRAVDLRVTYRAERGGAG